MAPATMLAYRVEGGFFLLAVGLSIGLGATAIAGANYSKRRFARGWTSATLTADFPQPPG